MRSRSPWVALTATAIAGALATTATAQVIAGRSIDGVTLGMTRTQVQGILGPPQTPAPSDNVLTYRRGAYTVVLTHGHATTIQTFIRGQRTASGFGVGTPVAALRHSHQPGLRCQSKPGTLNFFGNGQPPPVTSEALSAGMTTRSSTPAWGARS